MVDLFRFIEHEFAVPMRTDVIDVANGSDFQQALEEAVVDDQAESPVSERPVSERLRAIADEFLAGAFASPTADPTVLGDTLAALGGALSALPSVSSASVRTAIRDTFGRTAKQTAASADFKRDRELLENAAVAVKLVTAFGRVDAARIARQLRAAALVVLVAEADGSLSLDRQEVRRLLARPLRVPPGPLAAVAPPRAETRAEAPPDSSLDERIHALRRERDQLEGAHHALLMLRPDEMQVVASEPVDPVVHDGEAGEPEGGHPSGERDETSSGDAGAALLSSLRLTEGALGRFRDEELEAVRSLGIDPVAVSLPLALDRVGQRLAALNEELLPHEAVTGAKVFQVGGHLFAESAESVTPLVALADEAMPDFSKAVTRPVGFGNLQVVRQELIGYKAGEISHIENVLEGEVLRRRTLRTEASEVIETDETVSSHSQERDHQSTDRNELATESQKEAGHQSTTAGAGMTSSDYGKLVENSKSNFAQTIVARSVESVTQEVRTQRVRRESRTYQERVRHLLDNQDGTTKVRGIYQWVDKRYSLRVLNYGRRLMYDVVVPEPAAVLTQALKDSVQPESFQLIKPLDPGLTPSQVNAYNYQWYAGRYGVSGSVSPPPAVFDKTVAQSRDIKGSQSGKAYGFDITPPDTGSFTLRVPENYKAVRGFVQMVNPLWFNPAPGRWLEIFLGDRYYQRVGSPENPFLSASFTMSGETGELPVTYRTFDRIYSTSFAVGVVCQRTDEAYAAWQLKTHATIVAGYQRQIADYEDKLGRYVAAARARLAAAGGYGHDPTVVRDELKRAFVHLLLGEHPTSWLPTPSPAPAPPTATLPDPVAVREWGSMVAFFERAFEWENLMFTCYPYYWARTTRWQEMLLTQDADPQFEAFLKAGAARVVVPVRPGFEAALAHFQETGDVWMGEEIPDMFGDHYVSIIEEIKAANFAPGKEECVEQWEVTLPTTLVLLKEDASLPSWTATPCNPEP